MNPNKYGKKLLASALAAVTAFGLTLSGCSSSSGDDETTMSSSANVIDYWLWDSAQQPGYQKCAEGFAKANPGLSVKITQMGWDDYWSKLTAGFVADQAPDVFTNHLGKYAQFVDLGVLLPLDDLDATKDINSDDFQEGLGDLWKGQDGKRYGAPKDWDTIGYFYDKLVTDAAGLTTEQLKKLTWNPDDGGTFEKAIAHLTVDVNGKRGDEPGFDKNKVKVYGLASDGAGGGNFGQTQWGAYAASHGWAPTDKNPWGTKFRMEDPTFQKTVAWYYGLADSVTRFTDNREASAKWVAYMASDQCQNIIGASGVVFPARKKGTEISLETRKKAGLDVSAFTEHVEKGTTQQQVVIQNAADVTALMEPEFDAQFIGSHSSGDLTRLNEQLNTLFEITAK